MSQRTTSATPRWCAAPSSWPSSARQAGPNPRVGASSSTATVPWSARAATAARAPRTPRWTRWPRAGERARGGTAVVTLEPCNHTGRTGPCAQALIDAGVARVVHAQPTPTPSPQGAPTPCAPPGSRSSGGVLQDEARAAQRGPGPSPSSTAGRGHVEVRRDAGRRGRPPPTAAAPGSPARSRGPTCTTCAPSATPSSSAPAPSSRTTPTSPCATPTAPLRGRQPLRVVMGLRPLAGRPRGCWTRRRPASCCRTRDPAEALAALLSAVRSGTCGSRAAPRWPPRSCAAGLVDEVVTYLAPALLGAGPAAVGDLGIPTIDRALRLDGPRRRAPSAPTSRIRRHDPPEENLMFTGIVEELGEVAAIEQRRRRRRLTRARPARRRATPRTAPRSPSTASA